MKTLDIQEVFNNERWLENLFYMNFFSPGDQDLQNILGGMSQQQFMQLIGEKPSRIIFSLINLILSLLFDYFYMILLLIINLMRFHCLST